MKLRYILITGLALTLAACASVLFPVNRDRVADRLMRASLQIPEGLAATLAREMPRPVAKVIAKGDYYTDAKWFVRCIALDSLGSNGPAHEAMEYLCVCRTWRKMNYVSFLREQAGQWINLWDTVMACDWPSLQVDTVRLGIEPNWRPTTQLRNAVAYAGTEEFHFFQWDGVTAHHIIQPLAIGNWCETLDIDGDGVMELNIPVAGDERGVWKDRVYTYRPEDNEHRLDSMKVFPDDRGYLEFDASIPKDTFFTYESIWVSFVARNKSRVPFPYAPLSISSSDIRLAIFDKNGDRVGEGGNSDVLRLGPPIDARLCQPGDTLIGIAQIDDNAGEYDTTCARRVTPPGEYTATFRWKYDLGSRPIFNGSLFLEDTMRYMVLTPEGVDSAACFAWRSLNWRSRKAPEDARQLLNVYKQFGNTPFGAMALYRLIGLTSSNSIPYPDNTDRNWLKREMALTYPDYPAVGLILRNYVRENTEEEVRLLYEEIRDSVPNTLAGRLAAEYLDTH